jgi:hypothetical protein
VALTNGAGCAAGDTLLSVAGGKLVIRAGGGAEGVGRGVCTQAAMAANATERSARRSGLLIAVVKFRIPL